VAAKADAGRLCKRLDGLKANRLPHEPHWKNCFDVTFPLRGSGFQSSTLDAQSAQSQRAKLLDSTGTDSAKVLAAGLMGGLTPSNSLWFGLTVDKQTDEEARWLDASAPVLWGLIHGSNYDAEGYECCQDIVSAGWFVLYIDTDRETGEFSFEQWPLASCYITASKRGGKIDTVYREYQLSAEQAVDDFGDECSADLKKLAGEKPDELVTFCHAIYPRAGGKPDALLPIGLPFASCHVELKTKSLVRESGYHEFPCVVPRWSRLSNSQYAVGPAYDALPEMFMLNQLNFDELANADLAISGMWIAEDDGVLNPRTLKVGPRKVIVANSVDSMKPLEAPGDWQLAEYMIKSKQAQVRKVFMADQLQPADTPGEETAYEVHVRVTLIRQLLGPTYGRLQSEHLQPMIDRTFGLAFRAGKFEPAPRSLVNRTIRAKYASPLARAQRAEEVTAMDQYETSLAQNSMIDPQIVDNYDMDGASRERAMLLGVPLKLVRTQDEVDEKREARAEARKALETQQIAAAGKTAFAEEQGRQIAGA